MAGQTDLLILGGGTGGYVTAIRAAQKGLNVTIVERYKLGGTCLHKSCIPIKALLRSAKVLDALKQAVSFGIETEVASIDSSKVQQRKEGIIEQLHEGVEDSYKKNKIRISADEGAILGPSIFLPVSGAVAATFDDPTREEEIIVPENVVIATGSSSKTLPSLPLDEGFILSSDGMLELEELPESVVIISSDIIGAGQASLLNNLGVNVTITEFPDRLLVNESATVSKGLEKRLEQRGINISLGSKVREAKVTGQEVQVEVTRQGTLTIDKVIVAVRRQPNTNKLGLQNTLVKYAGRGIEVDEFYQTIEGYVYAIGDYIDVLQLTHMAMREEELAVQHLLGEATEPLNYINIPRGIYTNPGMASVGYTRETLPAEKEVVIGTSNLSGNGKSLVCRETDGPIEVVRDEKTDDLLGVSMIGPHVTDLIAEASTTTYLGAVPTEIGEAIHAHPTMTEVS